MTKGVVAVWWWYGGGMVVRMVVVSRMMVLYVGPTKTGSFYHVCARDQRKRHLAG